MAFKKGSNCRTMANETVVYQNIPALPAKLHATSSTIQIRLRIWVNGLRMAIVGVFATDVVLNRPSKMTAK